MTAEAFTAHVREHGALLEGTAGRLLANPADAEDALQEALLRAYVHRDACSGEPRRWLWRITRNASLSALRRRRARREIPIESAVVPCSEPAAPLLDDAERAAVRRAVLALPDAQREVVVRHYWRGEPVRAIAAALEQEEGAVKMRLVRARRQLRVALSTLC